MRISLSPPLFVCFVITSLLFSCATEDTVDLTKDAVINELQMNLNLDQSTNRNIAENVIVNWEHFTKTQKDDFEIYEVEVNEKNSSKIESNVFQSELKYTLINIKKEGENHSYLIEAYSSVNHDLYSNSIQNLKSFTGTLSVYDLHGNSIGQLIVFNGKSKNPSNKKALLPLNESINLYSAKENTTSKVPECYVSEHIYAVYTIYTNHYVYVTAGTYTERKYSHTSIDTVTITEPISVPCGTSEDSYDIVKRISIYKDVIDIKIINELTGKAKCLNDLLDKNGDSFVQNLLAKFEGNSEFDIKIVSKDKVFSKVTGLEINGDTRYTKGNPLITIEISTSKTNEHAALEATRTILHEYIHADMYRKLNTIDDTNIDVLDFKKTYEAYGNQHGAMGALYINRIKEVLKAFHKKVLTDDYNKYTNYYGEAPSDAFYEALAWGGLRDSNVKSWTDLPAEKKAAIEKLANRVHLLSKTVPCPN